MDLKSAEMSEVCVPRLGLYEDNGGMASEGSRRWHISEKGSEESKQGDKEMRGRC